MQPRTAPQCHSNPNSAGLRDQRLPLPQARTYPPGSWTRGPQRSETASRTRPTEPACSDTTTTRVPAHQLTKSLTRARWGLRCQTTRIAELEAELGRCEARADGYRADIKSVTEQLEEAQPGALLSLHDVSGGAR